MFNFINRRRAEAELEIDIGHGHYRAFASKSNAIFSEPSVVALHSETGELLHVGRSALKAAARVPDVKTIRPITHNLPPDPKLIEYLIAHIINQASPREKTTASIMLPASCTLAAIDAIATGASDAGCAEITFLPTPVAAARSVTRLSDSGAICVVDIGEAKTESAVATKSRTLVSNMTLVAGKSMNQDIIDHIKKIHRIDVGYRSAEDLKKTVGNAIRQDNPPTATVKGRGLADGLPRAIEVDGNEVLEALTPALNAIAEQILETIAKCPAEFARGLKENGILLLGGGAELPGLLEFLSQKIESPITKTRGPIMPSANESTTVMRGLC